MPGNLWLYVVMSLTLVGTGVLTGAALSSCMWFRVACGDGEWLEIGLWTACRPSFNNMTGVGMGKDGCGGVDNVLLGGYVPVWMSGARLLVLCSVGSAGVTFLLMFAFCFLPPYATLNSAHGLGGCGFGTAAFGVCSLLDSYVGRAALGDMLEPAVCGEGTGVGPVLFSRGYHLTLGGTVLCLLSGMAATGARMVFASGPLDSGEEGDGSGGKDGEGENTSQHQTQKTYLKFRRKVVSKQND